MSKITKILLTVLPALFAAAMSYAQPVSPREDKVLVSFYFLPAEDLFTLKGNEAELVRLYALIDKHRTQITEGTIPVYVDGYCASLPTAKENLNTAFIRANRVKSELILNKGLQEADFITKNYATAHEGNKDMVVVTLRILVKAEEPKQAEPVKVEPKQREPVKEELKQAEPEQQPQPVVETASEPVIVVDARAATYGFAVRTNVLYDAFLLPTLGVEWRVNRDMGIKLDGGFAWWGGNTDKVQKMWILNPEVRWYLGNAKRLYAGVSGNFGKYNTYGFLLGKLWPDNTGYQGSLWGAGLTVGYQLSLSRSFSVDFNLGLGYTRLEYDSFTMIEGVRVYKDRGQSKNFWGPTQVGISLMWTIGGNK